MGLYSGISGSPPGPKAGAKLPRHTGFPKMLSLMVVRSHLHIPEMVEMSSHHPPISYFPRCETEFYVSGRECVIIVKFLCFYLCEFYEDFAFT